MVVLVCGSRNWSNFEVILSRLAVLSPSRVIHGGCAGADELSGKAAKQLGFEVQVFKADWKRFGRAAGPMRNKQMLDEGRPDLVLAFHNDLENSRGTLDMVRRAKASGIKVEIIR